MRLWRVQLFFSGMPRLAANLSTMFREAPFLERFSAARKAGFQAVEYQYPYEFGADDVAAAAREAGVQVVLHNMPPGDPVRGEHGTACLPGREQRFQEDLERAITYARAAGCKALHCLAGVAPQGADAAALDAVFIANLKHAADRLGREGMRALIEPLSAGTLAGCYLRGSAQAVRLLERIGADNAFLQYDFFHMQQLEGNLAATVERLLPRIGHMQLADVPGRHEPGTGEINFAFLLPLVDRLGYAGWVGCEYNPLGDTVKGLRWAQPYL
jgi:hydroxypyruvate isomerase